ncbi:MAG: hypothetical protein HYU63_05575 [Armatimonadetes bacterium]|nr:hypothetical protein [Armatimonadota bacterium]
MNIWMQAGIGILSNLLGGINQQSHLKLFQEMQQKNLAQLQQTFMPSGEELEKTLYPVLDLEKEFSYPEKETQKFQKMQIADLNLKETLARDLHDNISKMKENFFKENHYEAKTNQKGETELALNEKGKPIIKQGGEEIPQKVARLKYEDLLKKDIFQEQQIEKENFLKQERQNIIVFLETNKNNLKDPSIQNELQKMVILTQKKAQKLKRAQETESAGVDLPSEEMKEFLKEKAEDIYKLEDEQILKQVNSKEGQVLKEYQEKLAKALTQRKEKLQVNILEEKLLKKPQFSAKGDLSDLLPPYLSDILAQMEIYYI